MAAEDHIADKGRPFTGAEYLASLNDGREVYIDGERVSDVANHPAYRNSARSIARLYDALHAPETRDVLTCPTDTGSGGYTHRFFRAAHSSADLFGQRDAIAAWARLSYGWMGRTADYKAALTNTLGANAEWYGDYADNARAWHRRAQEAVLFMNHAIVNPPIDRNRPANEVKDVYVSIDEETDAGIVVSGAKVVATSSALTHYNFLSQTSPAVMEDPSLAVIFMMAMNSPGVKMFSRVSYEQAAGRNGSPFDYPLSSRFDENDAILVLDRVLIPWENVLLKGDGKKIMAFQGRSGFMQGYCFQGCTRLAVKLDFLAGLLAKALKATGGDEFRGNQAMLGEVISYRNLMWTLTDAMAGAPVSWVGDAVLPSMQAAMSYRALAPDIYPRIKDIIEKTVASGLIYLPSSVKDFKNPDIDPYLRQYVRGSGDMDYKERIKIMKLLWDSIGTEFGGRHELYERNYAGALEDIRLQALMIAQRGGAMNQMQALVDRCMADYDENGWTGEDWLDPSAIGRMLSKQTYRDAMARLTGAVNIISSDGEAGLAGFTASAVCSVTDDPPMLLVCVNLSSRQDNLLHTNGVLCVNTLAAGQEDVARAFSTSGAEMSDRFAAARWTKLQSGAPVLEGALAVFDCRIAERWERGTHAVVLCDVLAARSGQGEPLVYFDRAYRQLSGLNLE